MSRFDPRNLGWLWLAVATILVDHLTKWLAGAKLVYATPEPVLPFFNLTLLHNTGAAFSFLAHADGWQRWAFAALAVVVVLALLVWLLRLPGPGTTVPGTRLAKAGIAVIIGGAIGNLIDRLDTGYVIDFLDLHAFGYHWPAFNVADSAITVGVVLLFLTEWIRTRGTNRDG